MENLNNREIEQAQRAGQRALESLYEVQDSLGTARNWGIFDLLGGGLLTDMMKHSRIREASLRMEEAREYLLEFQRELKDVELPLDLRMEVGGFLSFADFFFDGVIADYLVQSRIGEAREQVEDAIFQVNRLLEQLGRLKASI